MNTTKFRSFLILSLFTHTTFIFADPWNHIGKFIQSMTNPPRTLLTGMAIGSIGASPLVWSWCKSYNKHALAREQLKVEVEERKKRERKEQEEQEQIRQHELRRKDALHMMEELNRSYSLELSLLPQRNIETELYNPNEAIKKKLEAIIISKFNKFPFNSYYERLTHDLGKLHSDTNIKLFEKECQRAALITYLQNVEKIYNSYFAKIQAEEKERRDQALRLKREEMNAKEKEELEIKYLRTKVTAAEHEAGNKNRLEQLIVTLTENNRKTELDKQIISRKLEELNSRIDDLKNLTKKNQVVTESKQSEIKHELKDIKTLANKPTTPAVITVKVPEATSSAPQTSLVHSNNSIYAHQLPAYNPEYTAAEKQKDTQNKNGNTLAVGNAGNPPLYPILTQATPSAPPL